MSTKVKSVKTTKAAEAKAKKKIESYTKSNPGLLIDRHGDDCGYIIYSPYFPEKTILSLNDDAPRLITLETWERWGKQARAFEKTAKKVTKGLDQLNSVTKYKTKPKAKKKGGK